MLGSGYVGLVSAACFAELGHDVVAIDRDAAKVEQLGRGEIPIFEPGLQDLVTRNLAAGRLSFVTAAPAAVAGAEVVFVAVGTPSRRGDGYADLSFVHAAVREIADALDAGTILAIKSTVPAGTGDAVQQTIAALRPGANIAVVSNPEFLREGAAIEDFMSPDRIVVGIEDERARAVLTGVYQPLGLDRIPLLFVGRRAAELTKYAANAFLAMKITFINEMADLAETIGADVADIARGIGLDHRIGEQFLKPGPGFGGSCLPKDTRALMKTAQDNGRVLRLVEATIAVNDARPRVMADKIIAACGGNVRGKTVAILGLTFKPDTDDMREAPSLTIIGHLQSEGATIRAYDPEGMTAAAAMIRDVTFASDAHDAATGADAAVIVTDWSAFRSLDLRRLATVLRVPVLVDLRNLFEPATVARYGLTYFGLGRPSPPAR